MNVKQKKTFISIRKGLGNKGIIIMTLLRFKKIH